MSENGIGKKNVGETFVGFLLVQDVFEGIARNGNDYLNVTLSDKTGDVKAMVWQVTDVEQEVFTKGNIVKVQGAVGEFQGIKQLNMQQYRLVQDEDGVQLSDLLESAPIEGEQLVYEIKEEIEHFTNEKIKAITLAVFEKYESDFKVYPAAKSVHHDYVSGLAFHTYTMMSIAKSLCSIYPNLNKDLLIAGVILHDLGKVDEYTGYVSTDVTLEGKLKGHISIINEEIGKVANELGLDVAESEEALLLQHMVLSHHGKGEWGSPVPPLIIEAQVLHQIDMIDARMESYNKASKNVEVGEFTERSLGLDNRSFYKHNL